MREVRARLVQNVALTVQVFALLGFLFSVLGIAIAPQLRVEMEFSLVGICVVSAFVLLANNLRHEAGTAIWFGAIASFVVATDITGTVAKTLTSIFGFVCLWLFGYLTLGPRTGGSE